MSENWENPSSVTCPNCGENTDESYIEYLEDPDTCPHCGERFTPKVEPQPLEREWLRASSVPSLPHQTWPQGKRRHGTLKNLAAVIIGIVGGFILKVVLFIPLFMLFATEEGFPHDLTLILELFTAFFAGAIAGSLVPRYGWLFGMLTQMLKLILVVVIMGSWGYIVATDAESELSTFGPLMSPEMRLLIFSLLVAAIAGAVAERHRDNIMSFLGTTFGFLGSSFGCLLHAAGGLFYIYVIYLGGKAIFADGEIFKGLLIVFILGPLASYLASFLLIGIFFVIFWSLGKIYDWYAKDLGLPPFLD